MKTITETLEFSKSTPGTHVYKSTEKEPAVPTIYIKRGAMDEKPERIKIIVESD